MPGLLECVINISEGRRLDLIAQIGAAAGEHLLDVHTDAHHHRSVLTLAGPAVEAAAFEVVVEAVAHLDLRDHEGVHPRLGVADVVPFVPLEGSTMEDAVAARDRLARRISDEIGVPCLTYGPERTLPDLRRHGRDEVEGHPTAGICCVGARPVLVAYNVWLSAPATLADAKRIAAEVRSPTLRTLGLAVGDGVQVSCNLIEPSTTGPDAAFDAVAARAPGEATLRAELVGLVPASVLAAIPRARHPQLDLSTSRTIEARLSQAGLDGGSFSSGQ